MPCPINRVCAPANGAHTVLSGGEQAFLVHLTLTRTRSDCNNACFTRCGKGSGCNHDSEYIWSSQLDPMQVPHAPWQSTHACCAVGYCCLRDWAQDCARERADSGLLASKALACSTTMKMSTTRTITYVITITRATIVTATAHIATTTTTTTLPPPPLPLTTTATTAASTPHRSHHHLTGVPLVYAPVRHHPQQPQLRTQLSHPLRVRASITTEALGQWSTTLFSARTMPHLRL